MSQKILRDQQIVADHWQRLEENQELPDRGQFILSLEQWQSLGSPHGSDALAIGLQLPNSEDVEALWPQLSSLPLIALEFPVYSDGRAYSQARILRDRLGFTGELRAVGAVIRDQIWEMARCGFNAIVPREDQNLDECLEAYKDFSLAYQSAADQRPSIFRRRLVS